MAKFSRLQVINEMHRQGMVPLFYSDDIDTSKEVLRAIYSGGGRLIEFTNRGDFAHEIFADLVKFVRQELADMIIGAGSVHDAATAAIFIQSGADFIVSHVTNPEVARNCNRRKILWIPGCSTATEIANAEELGADIVKIFPGSTLGPSFVKSILAPSPWTSIMPTGGVAPTEENLTGWFDAGVVCVGMGSKLIDKNSLKSREFDTIESRVKSTLDLVNRIRS